MPRCGDLVLVPVDPTLPELRALVKHAILAASSSLAFAWCRFSKILRVEPDSLEHKSNVKLSSEVCRELGDSECQAQAQMIPA